VAAVHADVEEVRRRFGAYLVSGLVMVWVLLGLALVAIIGLEALAMEDRCPVPGLVETSGELTWQAWPPARSVPSGRRA